MRQCNILDTHHKLYELVVEIMAKYNGVLLLKLKKNMFNVLVKNHQVLFGVALLHLMVDLLLFVILQMLIHQLEQQLDQNL